MRIVMTLVLLSACTPFPALQSTISDAARAAPYPALTPVPPLAQADNAEAAALAPRIAALQARAARLRQIDIGALQ